jgi:hypothetical protein
MSKEQYIELRRVVPLEKVSCGYRTVTLFPSTELEDAQIGYGIGEAGEDFTGTSDGDWRPNWPVIGYEEVCGDPIFIDLRESALPVFTAAHGQGRWDAELIASSLTGFLRALAEVDRISTNRRNPVELERHPLTDVEKEQVLKQVAKVNGKGNLEFWESWFEV